jgi:putative transposase
MKRKRFSVEQIVAVLKQAELGMPVGRYHPPGRHLGADVLSLEEALRWLAIGSGARAEGLAGRERAAEEFVAELSLDKAILQDVATKNWRGPR